jgi:hypothetical protein
LESRIFIDFWYKPLLTDVTHPNDISIKIVGYENT